MANSLLDNYAGNADGGGHDKNQSAYCQVSLLRSESHELHAHSRQQGLASLQEGSIARR